MSPAPFHHAGRRLGSVGAVAVATALLAGCWKDPGLGPPLGYEGDIESCHDGIDNDRDGRVDCADPDCVRRGFCNEIVPLVPPNEPDEDTYELCSNRIDDDGDGNFDCGDRSCGQFMELCCSTEFTDERCSNGIDDDENGYTDCEDFGCRQGLFVTVCDEETICDDGEDNDGDRLVDCDDCDCVRADACGAIPAENTLEACSNGIDDDCNGFVDCRDFACSMSTDPDIMAHCASGEPENTEERCSDGLDNDGNGYTDCQDFGCAAFCESEDTFEACTDGIDNDRNGYVDCNDFSCRGMVEPLDAARTRFRSPCVESGFTPDSLARYRRGAPLSDAEAAANARESCSNGIDDDRDGFVDCDDWDCNWNPLLIGPDGTRFCEERTGILLCR